MNIKKEDYQKLVKERNDLLVSLILIGIALAAILSAAAGVFIGWVFFS